MTTLAELLHRYQESGTLEDEDRVCAQLREFAGRNTAEFLCQFRALPLNYNSPVGWIYEALSDDSKRWAAFFLEEFDRIVESVSVASDPDSVLSLLNCFHVFGQDENEGLRRPLLRRLCRCLSHPHPAVRRGCVTLLIDFVGHEDIKELMALAQVAQSDDEWQVRYMAYQALEQVWPSKAKKINLPLWIQTKGRIARLDTVV